MNIFALDNDPLMAARMHCDKHVVKMILESAQMLCAVHHIYDTPESHDEWMYRPTHTKHPCTLWAAENTANYRWLHQLMHWLHEEYKFRYGAEKNHKSYLKLHRFLDIMPRDMEIANNTTKFALAMPDQYKFGVDAVDCYRMYYVFEKSNILQYTRRKRPSWIN